MDNVKILKPDIQKELQKEIKRTYYGIFLLLIVYGALIISYLFWIAENDNFNK